VENAPERKQEERTGGKDMENDDILVGRILSRREVLQLAGAAGVVILTGCGGGSGTVSASSTTTNTTANASTSSTAASSTPGVVVTPAETEGPFFVDENLNRSNLLAGTTRASVVNGLPLALQLKVYQVSGSAVTTLSGAHVDVWHADAIGAYSDEAAGSIQSENTTGQTWLRGYQVTDANGAVSFTTIYPGWYIGRTIHIHFKVRLYASSGSKTYEFSSQLFMDDTINDTVLANAPYSSRGTRPVRNSTDGIYNAKESDGTVAGAQLLLTLTKASGGSGYVGTFTVGLQIS
jgi:protocatechuate 3,4-dioxygenase beta subunit